MFGRGDADRGGPNRHDVGDPNKGLAETSASRQDYLDSNRAKQPLWDAARDRLDRKYASIAETMQRMHQGRGEPGDRFDQAYQAWRQETGKQLDPDTLTWLKGDFNHRLKKIWQDRYADPQGTRPVTSRPGAPMEPVTPGTAMSGSGRSGWLRGSGGRDPNEIYRRWPEEVDNAANGLRFAFDYHGGMDAAQARAGSAFDAARGEFERTHPGSGLTEADFAGMKTQYVGEVTSGYRATFAAGTGSGARRTFDRWQADLEKGLPARFDHELAIDDFMRGPFQGRLDAWKQDNGFDLDRPRPWQKRVTEDIRTEIRADLTKAPGPGARPGRGPASDWRENAAASLPDRFDANQRALADRLADDREMSSFQTLEDGSAFREIVDDFRRYRPDLAAHLDQGSVEKASGAYHASSREAYLDARAAAGGRDNAIPDWLDGRGRTAARTSDYLAVSAQREQQLGAAKIRAAEQDGTLTLADDAVDRVRGQLGRDLTRAYHEVWGGHPGEFGRGPDAPGADRGRWEQWRQRTEMVDHTLDARILHEQHLNTILGYAARDFDALVGPIARPRFAMSDPARDGLAGQYRDEYASTYQSIFGRPGERLDGWLAHEQTFTDQFGRTTAGLRFGQAWRDGGFRFPRTGDDPATFRLRDGWVLESHDWGMWARPPEVDPGVATQVRSGSYADPLSDDPSFVVGSPNVDVPLSVVAQGKSFIDTLPSRPGGYSVTLLGRYEGAGAPRTPDAGPRVHEVDDLAAVIRDSGGTGGSTSGRLGWDDSLLGTESGLPTGPGRLPGQPTGHSGPTETVPNADGGITHLFGDNGRVTIDPTGRTSTRVLPDGRGGETTETYRNGRLIRTTDADGISWAGYDQVGRPHLRIGPDGRTGIDYRSNDRLYTRPNGSEFAHHDGELVRHTTPDGTDLTAFDRVELPPPEGADPAHIADVRRPTAGNTADGRRFTVDHHPDGTATLHYADGSTLDTRFDSAGRPTRGRDPRGREYAIDYDADGTAIRTFDGGDRAQVWPHTDRPDPELDFAAWHQYPHRYTPGRWTERHLHGQLIEQTAPDGTRYTDFTEAGVPREGRTADGRGFTISTDGDTSVYRFGDGRTVRFDGADLVEDTGVARPAERPAADEDGYRFGNRDELGRARMMYSPTNGPTMIDHRSGSTVHTRADGEYAFDDGTLVRHTTDDGTDLTAFDDRRPVAGNTADGRDFTIGYGEDGTATITYADGGTLTTRLDRAWRPLDGRDADGRDYTITYSAHGTAVRGYADGTVREVGPGTDRPASLRPDGVSFDAWHLFPKRWTAGVWREEFHNGQLVGQTAPDGTRYTDFTDAGVPRRGRTTDGRDFTVTTDGEASVYTFADGSTVRFDGADLAGITGPAPQPARTVGGRSSLSHPGRLPASHPGGGATVPAARLDGPDGTAPGTQVVDRPPSGTASPEGGLAPDAGVPTRTEAGLAPHAPDTGTAIGGAGGGRQVAGTGGHAAPMSAPKPGSPVPRPAPVPPPAPAPAARPAPAAAPTVPRPVPRTGPSFFTELPSDLSATAHHNAVILHGGAAPGIPVADRPVGTAQGLTVALDRSIGRVRNALPALANLRPEFGPRLTVQFAGEWPELDPPTAQHVTNTLLNGAHPTAALLVPAGMLTARPAPSAWVVPVDAAGRATFAATAAAFRFHPDTRPAPRTRTPYGLPAGPAPGTYQLPDGWWLDGRDTGAMWVGRQLPGTVEPTRSVPGQAVPIAVGEPGGVVPDAVLAEANRIGAATGAEVVPVGRALTGAEQGQLNTVRNALPDGWQVVPVPAGWIVGPAGRPPVDPGPAALRPPVPDARVLFVDPAGTDPDAATAAVVAAVTGLPPSLRDRVVVQPVPGVVMPWQGVAALAGRLPGTGGPVAVVPRTQFSELPPADAPGFVPMAWTPAGPVRTVAAAADHFRVYRAGAVPAEPPPVGLTPGAGAGRFGIDRPGLDGWVVDATDPDVLRIHRGDTEPMPSVPPAPSGAMRVEITGPADQAQLAQLYGLLEQWRAGRPVELVRNGKPGGWRAIEHAAVAAGLPDGYRAVRVPAGFVITAAGGSPRDVRAAAAMSPVPDATLLWFGGDVPVGAVIGTLPDSVRDRAVIHRGDDPPLPSAWAPSFLRERRWPDRLPPDSPAAAVRAQVRSRALGSARRQALQVSLAKAWLGPRRQAPARPATPPPAQVPPHALRLANLGHRDVAEVRTAVADRVHAERELRAFLDDHGVPAPPVPAIPAGAPGADASAHANATVMEAIRLRLSGDPVGSAAVIRQGRAALVGRSNADWVRWMADIRAARPEWGNDLNDLARDILRCLPDGE